MAFWVIVQGLFCSCWTAGSEREGGNHTGSWLSGDVFAVVVLVLLVIFFFSVYLMFGLFLQVLEHQSKEEKKNLFAMEAANSGL